MLDVSMTGRVPGDSAACDSREVNRITVTHAGSQHRQEQFPVSA